MRRKAVALAGFAAAAFHVEAEAAGAIAALARFGKHGEKFANGREDARVRRRIRARRAADGVLIDLNHFIEMLEADDRAVFSGLFHRAIKLLHQGFVKDVVDERGFAGARDAGDQN